MEWAILIPVLLLILAAEFVNGWNDACNSIATVVSTRVLSPMVAVIMAVGLNIVGAMSGTAVAATLGREVVQAPEGLSAAMKLLTVGSAVFSVLVWGAIASWRGLPVSITHALLGGLAGAGLASGGVLVWTGWSKVLLGLLFSTVFGFIAGYVLIVAILWLFRRRTPRFARNIFGKLQILSAGFMAFSHGLNDGQQFIGVFTMALVLGGALKEFAVTWPVILLCSVIMGIGTSIGGWRLIRTMGTRLVRLEPHHGFAAETGAAAMITIASRFGIPLSSTHTISTAIMGVGASRRLSAVRWGVAGQVVMAWVLTFPLCVGVSWCTAMLVGRLYAWWH